MDQLKNYYKEMGVDEKVFDYAQEVEKGLKDRFETLDAIAQLNQIKVLNAMQKHQIAEMCYRIQLMRVMQRIMISIPKRN